jgi:hypothetical protein
MDKRLLPRGGLQTCGVEGGSQTAGSIEDSGVGGLCGFLIAMMRGLVGGDYGGGGGCDAWFAAAAGGDGAKSGCGGGLAGGKRGGGGDISVGGQLASQAQAVFLLNFCLLSGRACDATGGPLDRVCGFGGRLVGRSCDGRSVWSGPDR